MRWGVEALCVGALCVGALGVGAFLQVVLPELCGGALGKTMRDGVWEYEGVGVWENEIIAMKRPATRRRVHRSLPGTRMVASDPELETRNHDQSESSYYVTKSLAPIAQPVGEATPALSFCTTHHSQLITHNLLPITHYS